MAGVKVYGKIHTARFGKVFRPLVSCVRVRLWQCYRWLEEREPRDVTSR